MLRLLDELETNRDILGGLLESYLSQASNRMNAVMKRLTALAMIGLPFTVVSGYFGMNFEVMPWLKQPWGIARGDDPHVRALGGGVHASSSGPTGCDAAAARRAAEPRGAAALALALVAASAGRLPGRRAALVGDLTTDGIREAIDAGIAAITQEDFGRSGSSGSRAARTSWSARRSPGSRWRPARPP